MEPSGCHSDVMCFRMFSCFVFLFFLCIVLLFVSFVGLGLVLLLCFDVFCFVLSLCFFVSFFLSFFLSVCLFVCLSFFLSFFGGLGFGHFVNLHHSPTCGGYGRQGQELGGSAEERGIFSMSSFVTYSQVQIQFVLGKIFRSICKMHNFVGVAVPSTALIVDGPLFFI